MDNITRELAALFKDQQRALTSSIERLETVKVGVDSITKEAEQLRKIGVDTADTLKAGNQSLSQSQDKLASSLLAVQSTLTEGNRNISEAQSKLSDSIVSIQKQLDAKFNETLVKQLDAIARLDDTTKKAQAIHALLSSYFADEMKAQLELTTIKGVKDALLPEISNMELQLTQLRSDDFLSIGNVIGIDVPGSLRVELLGLSYKILWAQMELLRNTGSAFDTSDFDKLVGPIAWSSNSRLSPQTFSALYSQVITMRLTVQTYCDDQIERIYKDRLAKADTIGPATTKTASTTQP